MISIFWKQIKYDVDQQTWRLAKVHITDKEIKDEAQTDGSETSELYIMRFAESGNAMVQLAIKEQLQSSSTVRPTDELEQDKTEWTYTFKETAEIDERAIAILIHKFIVAYCLYKWASTYATDKAQIFNSDMVNTLAELTKAVFTMKTPLKKHNYPKIVEPKITVENT